KEKNKYNTKNKLISWLYAFFFKLVYPSLSFLYDNVSFFFLVVLMVNKNSPNITTVPPSHREAVTTSPRIKYARMDAPIGSKTIAIEIVKATTPSLSHLN